MKLWTMYHIGGQGQNGEILTKYGKYEQISRKRIKQAKQEQITKKFKGVYIYE